MNILFASFFPLPHQGGIWTYVDLLRRELEHKGHTVDIMSRHPSEPAYYLLNRDRRLARDSFLDAVRRKVKASLLEKMDASDLAQSFDGNWSLLDIEVERYGFELAAAYFGLQGYDLIHAQEIISSRALSRIKPLKTPLITTLHGVLTYELLQRGAFDKHSLPWNYSYAAECIGARSADALIVPTVWMKELWVRDFLLDPAQLNVIPHGMDLNTFFEKGQEPSDLSPPSGKQLIICPARLDSAKGHLHLLDALVRLKHTRQDWHCWLIGEGPLEHTLRRRCRELGLQEEVSLQGYRDNIPALLGQADIFVLPSLTENQPFAILEAQAAGLPIIASDVGGIPEMIRHEQTGLLVPPGHSEALFRQLDRLLSDADLRQRLSRNAAGWGRQQWPAERMVERTLSLYRQISKQIARGEEESET